MRLADFKIDETFTSTNGVCYVATSLTDGKTYFIKRNTDVSYGLPTDPPALKKEYKAEADAWLNYHNRIIQAFRGLGGNGTGNTVYPIQYFVDEGMIYELAHYVKINKLEVSEISKLPDEKKKMILQTSTYALKSVHSLGLVHCDLKPDNVPICTSEMGGYISKITDCGDAIFANDVPDEGQIVCTEPYWSPELAAYKFGNENVKSRISPMNDVYAMGLIFHEWWTGNFPEYEGRDDFGCLYQVVHKSWPNKIKIHSNVPGWLGDLIIDMLYPEPEGRPTMDVVFDAIRNGEYTPMERVGSSGAGNKKKQQEAPKPLSHEKFKDAIAMVPSQEELKKYTDESVTKLFECLDAAKANVGSMKTQAQLDKLAEIIVATIKALEIKVVPYEKIAETIAKIESKDLSFYAPAGVQQLQKLIAFAKAQKDNLTDQTMVDKLNAAIISAYNGLELNDNPYEVVSPLPAPYTKVEFGAPGVVYAYYGAGKIKLTTENAVKMKLLRRK